jgi:hypothetical protein
VEIQSQQNVHGQQLAKQEAEIRSIRFALQGIVTKYEIEKLEGLLKELGFSSDFKLCCAAQLTKGRSMAKPSHSNLS